MTAIDIDQERAFDESEYEKNGEPKEGYEAYRTKNLPEGYTPYNGTDQAVELVYDRYDSDYETEQPGQEAKSTSCAHNESCKKGWLLNLLN